MINLGTRALTSTGLQKRGIGVGAKALNSELGENWWTRGSNTHQNCINLGHQKLKTKTLKQRSNQTLPTTLSRMLKKAVENLFG